ncbi:polysaccharide biosynthesis/export family protein [Paenalcaligenes faecalis]|uniref:polysaccharide biosynthesis/export family protein n=1 Tax=Paenalcaligenes faecalis TaxID=2980099 RepID=UPI0022B99AC3|nr:polysaccharide biosynthesis/export family protein [Paenalcaligenes faecalis]
MKSISLKLLGSMLMITALSGCASSIFSGAGPTKGAILDSEMSNAENGQYQLVSLSASTIAPYMRPPLAALKPEVSVPSMPDLKLGAGDVISVMMADSAEEGSLFAPIATGGTVFDKVRVNAKGQISLPYAGRLKVGGLSLNQAEDLILKQIAKYTTEPQVHVSLVGDLAGSVLVVGDVVKPGRFSTLEGPLTLLDAINQAGGPKLEPYLVNVVVRTGNSVQSFGYQDLLNGLNQPVAPNAEIVVERARKRFVAMGAVGSPGLHDFPSQSPSLLEVLGSVGGLAEAKADARGVFVFRLPEEIAYDSAEQRVISDSKPLVFQLDMRDPTAMFLARQFLVHPEDAIYVTNAHAYEFQKLISPIIQVLVLGRTVGNL